MGGERRWQKSLRIGVHHANGVVWEPVRYSNAPAASAVDDELSEPDAPRRRAEDGVQRHPGPRHLDRADVSGVRAERRERGLEGDAVGQVNRLKGDAIDRALKPSSGG